MNRITFKLVENRPNKKRVKSFHYWALLLDGRRLRGTFIYAVEKGFNDTYFILMYFHKCINYRVGPRPLEIFDIHSAKNTLVRYVNTHYDLPEEYDLDLNEPINLQV